MSETPSPKNHVRKLLESHHFWLITAILIVSAFLHYTAQIRPTPITLFGAPSRLTRHAVERILLVLPIIYAALTFGMVGGLLTLAVAVLIMLPRILFVSTYPVDALFEMVAVILVGGLVSWLAEIQKREKRLRQEAIAELRFYARHITRAQEDERKRIAREIHDDTAQALLLLSRRLGVLATDEELSEPVAQSLEDLEELSRSTLQGVRRFSQDLRPPVLDDLGMLPALEGLTTDLSESGIEAKLEVRGGRRRLSAEAELALFRIAQEALTNVKKHSQAPAAVVTVEFSDTKVRLTVGDDGKGFQPPETLGTLAHVGRMGLIGMQERAQLVSGTFTLRSEPGQGATVIVDVPA
jgi:two-component system sensor histidine kinase DegS